MAETPGPSENLGKSPGSDDRHTRLLADFLLAEDPKKAETSLQRLQVDNLRRAVGMTPRERELAEGIETARDWAPVVAANVGVAGAAGAVSYVAPELRPYLGGAAGVGFVSGAGIEVAANTLAKIETRFPWATEVAKRLAAGRLGKWIMMLSLSGGFGAAMGGMIDFYLTSKAAQQAGAISGEGVVPAAGAEAAPGAVDHPSQWPTSGVGPTGEAAGGAGAGVGLGGQPPGEQAGPPKFTPEQTDWINRMGHSELAEAQQRETAELYAQQQAEAARQAAELQAATPVGVTGQELAGGTIWGNELEFVKQLGVHHVEPVTNLLKSFSGLLAQPQTPTEIGPTDTAYVINRDVAGWAAGQLDKLYMMEPSAMEPWQKALWEIGRGLRSAEWQDLQAVTEEFVKQAQH